MSTTITLTHDALAAIVADAIAAAVGAQNSAPVTPAVTIESAAAAARTILAPAPTGADMLAEDVHTGETREFREASKSERGKPLPKVKSGDAFRLTMESRGFTVEDGKVRVDGDLVGGFGHLGADESAARKEYRQRIKGTFRPVTVKSESAPVKPAEPKPAKPAKPAASADASAAEVEACITWQIANGMRNTRRGRKPGAAALAAYRKATRK